MKEKVEKIIESVKSQLDSIPAAIDSEVSEPTPEYKGELLNQIAQLQEQLKTKDEQIDAQHLELMKQEEYISDLLKQIAALNKEKGNSSNAPGHNKDE